MRKDDVSREEERRTILSGHYFSASTSMSPEAQDEIGKAIDEILDRKPISSHAKRIPAEKIIKPPIIE